MVFQRFLDDRNASVAPLLALSIVPILGLIGASVDYGRASSARATLQSLIDSTALAVAQDAAKASPPLTQDQVNAKASDYFNALYTHSQSDSAHTPGGAAAPVVTATYSPTAGSVLQLTATSSVNMTFMSILPFTSTQIPIAASSTAKWGNTRLRVALVLDNTGSMTGGGLGTTDSPNKIQALQTAGHNLLAQLQKAASANGDVYVSIIPFTKDVNVDPSNYTQSWVDFTAWDADNKACSDPKYHSRKNCKDNNQTWGPANHNTWNGCVTDRDQNDDTRNTAPANSTAFPAEQYSVCPVPLMPQSYDWTALNNKIDAMVAAGNTNQAIGLAWGWQSLTAGAPLNAPTKDANFQYQDIIILLSDGLNTEDRWYQDASSIDARQRILCDNIKTAGVTIYSVQVNTGSDATSSVLQYCAGTRPQVADASKFFLLKTPTEIITTFGQIATGLSKLRLAL
jgi:Flp pilus assembly protein TadG